MKKVFIGGSRHVSRLTPQVIERLENIVGRGFSVVVGDAAGADKAVQKYLVDASYPHVTVFCSGDRARNNLGQWKLHKVATAKTVKGFQFFAAKDREMAQEADFGLMIWDGKSPGTALNVLRLLRAGKKAVMLRVPDKQTVEFKSKSDWSAFIAGCESQLIEDLRSRATPEEWDAFEAKQGDLLESLDARNAQGEADASVQSDDQLADALNAAFATADLPTIMEAIGTVAKTRGMSHVAKETGLARESLYRSLTSGGNPEFSTVFKVMASVGIRLSVNKDSRR